MYPTGVDVKLPLSELCLALNELPIVLGRLGDRVDLDRRLVNMDRRSREVLG